MEALDVGTNRSPIHIALRNDDAVTAGDADDNAFLIRVNSLGLILWRLTYVETHLLDKRRSDDEEDEHDEHDVKHRRQVDLLVMFLLTTAAEWSAHVIPLEPLNGGRLLYYRAEAAMPSGDSPAVPVLECDRMRRRSQRLLEVDLMIHRTDSPELPSASKHRNRPMKSFWSKRLVVGVILSVLASAPAAASVPIAPLIEGAPVKGLSGLLQDPEGWTVASQFLAASGSIAWEGPGGDQLSRIIYVSASGDDQSAAKNPHGRGYYLPSDPEIGTDPTQPRGQIRAYATFAEAIKAVRISKDLRQGDVTRYPEWVLFERGGQYDLKGIPLNINVGQGGPSPEHRRVYAAYGPVIKERPRLFSSESITHSVQLWGDRGGANIAILSLDFASGKLPGTRFIYGAHDILIEDSIFRSLGAAQGGSKNLVFRRNVAHGAFNASAHVQGLYLAEVESVLLEQNVFDMNGYKEDPYDPSTWTASARSTLAVGELPAGTGVQPTRTFFDRNLYLSSYDKLTLVKNIISRGGGGGSTQMRVGGVADENVFLFNYIALAFGGSEANRAKLHDARARRNLVLHDDTLLPPGGFGGGLLVGVGSRARGQVEDNVIAHFHDRKGNHAMVTVRGIPAYADRPAEQAGEILVLNNALVSPRTLPLSIASPASPDGVAKGIIESNSISSPLTVGAMIVGTPTAAGLLMGATEGRGNRYMTPAWSDYPKWTALGLDRFSTLYSSQEAGIAAAGWRFSSANGGAEGWRRDIVSYMSAIDPSYRPDDQVTVDEGAPAGKRRSTAPRLVDTLTAMGMPAESARLSSQRYHAFLRFIERAKANRRGKWNYQYTSDALNNYIRDGFGKAPVNPLGTTLPQ